MNEDGWPSYHDLYVTTETIIRRRLFDMPFDYHVSCSRVGGWSLFFREREVAGEFHRAWLILDVNGEVVIDSRPAEQRTPESLYLTVREAARRLNVHENTIRNWVKNGRIRAEQLDTTTAWRRIPASEIARIKRGRADRLWDQ